MHPGHGSGSTLAVALFHIRGDRAWNPEYQGTLDALNAGAMEAVAALGFQAELVASAEVAEAVSLEAADRADVVVILGGEDVTPALYGASTQYQGAGAYEPEADAVHCAVIRKCLALRKPLLGICRGNQLINVALGGTLVQHLPQVDQHRGSGAGGEHFVRCAVTLTSDVLRDAVTTDVIDTDLIDPREPVLCSHHQAVDRLGDGLTAVAHAPDGVIEAVVHRDAPITGVQWHPEHPAVAHRQLTRLLKRLEHQHARSERLP